jgi:alanyl-tRNA synthetase
MQQHTAQHLLTAVALREHDWKTTAFHLGEDRSDIELDVAAISMEQLINLEALCAIEIRAANPVVVSRVSTDQYEAMGVRGRGLPDGHVGDVRLVEIDGLDLTSCGGTHVGNTANLEGLVLTGTESMRGGTRLHWVAGGRVRSRMRAHEIRNAVLRVRLGVGDGEFVEAVEAKLRQLKNSAGHAKHLERELASMVADGLASSDAPVICEHFEQGGPVSGPGWVQSVGRSFSGLPTAKVVLLTAADEDGAFFVLAAGKDSQADVAALGGQVAGILGARGGGSGRLYQGKAESVASRAQAVEALRAALKE